MAKTAIALIVAGTGEITEQETFDLLEDSYPIDNFEEVGLVVPIDKDLFSDAVKFAAKWFDNDKAVATIQTNGASLSRASAKLGESPDKVDKFSDILSREEFKEWDEVHFLVALPEDPEDPDYDLYAEMVEAAIDGGLTVKDLTKGLDDVELADDEPEPEEESAPEPEPVEEEKPAPRARRSRAKKVEGPEPDPVVTEAISEIADEPTPTPRAATETHKQSVAITTAIEVLGDAARFLDKWNEAMAIPLGEEPVYWPLNKRLRAAAEALADEGKDKTPTTPPKADSAPVRGRGRPRTQFEVKQIWDEDAGDDGEWIPRPQGRLKKGTEWRSIHAETSEVLDEGTA